MVAAGVYLGAAPSGGASYSGWLLISLRHFDAIVMEGDTARMERVFKYRCIICSYSMSDVPFSQLGREGPSCDGCGSSVRMRSVVYQLVSQLFGRPVALPDLPVSKQISGIGLSDWEGYAGPLSRIFSYKNTFFHADPFLDIAQIGQEYENTSDFIISSDVFEHVPPPVGRAFHGARRVLKPGGLLVLTVPFRDGAPGVEHFPDLHRFTMAELDGNWLLVNRSPDGSLKVYEDLVFHGGPGTTVEMRIFGRDEVVRLLGEAGFSDIRVHDEEAPEWGIVLQHHDGLPITARAPGR